MENPTSIYCFASFTPKTPRFVGSDKRLIDLIFGMALRVGRAELPGDAPWLLTEPSIFPGNLEIDREDRSLKRSLKRSQRSKAIGLLMPSLLVRDRSVAKSPQPPRRSIPTWPCRAALPPLRLRDMLCSTYKYCSRSRRSHARSRARPRTRRY
jgi:hypothetical protein